MLQQELKRALDRLPSHERDERLNALRSHFPVPEGGEVRVIEVEKPVAARQVTAEEALRYATTLPAPQRPKGTVARIEKRLAAL